MRFRSACYARALAATAVVSRGCVFQGADLVPSDIAAGLVLLASQHRRILESETLGRSAEEAENSGAKGHVDESKYKCTAPASFEYG